MYVVGPTALSKKNCTYLSLFVPQSIGISGSRPYEIS
ncbi:MAG: hypothetical protein BWY47_01291 [Bacteroidetes bacterium ADurb.Bin302]|nr:MAG: hypothetical protein BWY47_01291 [Bacteroidetes bacterium ADurb.Bin302]